jgi:itaconyl-CoA hydratase
VAAAATGGRFYEDFQVGDVLRHALGRTITESDNTWFTLLTMNTNQLHFNDDYASRSPFGRPLVSSGLTVAIVLGISVSDISQHAVANLGWDRITLREPVFVGDTLYAESVITGLRPSGSRSYAGIVSCFTRGLKQTGETVLTFRRSVMVHRRSSDRLPDRFPTPTVALDDLMASDGPGIIEGED